MPASVVFMRGVTMQSGRASFGWPVRILFLGIVYVLMSLLATPVWAQTPPPPPTTLSVTKTDAPAPTVEVGEDIAYTIEVRNTGTNVASNVVLTDDLPAGVVFQGASPPTVTGGTGGGTCTAPDSGDNGTVECDLNNIGVGETKTVNFTVRAVRGGVVENTATADGSNTEPDSDSARIRVGPNLVIDKIDDRDPVNVGGNILYTLRVTNEGSNDVSNIVVIDELPIGDVRLVSVDSNDFTCDRLDPPTGRIRCVRNTPLAADQTATIKITVDPEVAGTIENTAEVRFNRFLIDTDTETTLVKNSADTGGGGGGTGGGGGGGNNNGGGNGGNTSNSRNNVTCEDPKLVRTIGPRVGDVDATSEFKITGGAFRLTYTTEPVGTSGTPSLTVNVLDDAGNQTGDSFGALDGKDGAVRVVEGPGNFSLKIQATDVRYTIKIEDCTGEDKGGVIKDTVPKKTLSDTGGPLLGLLVVGLILAGSGLLLRATTLRW